MHDLVGHGKLVVDGFLGKYGRPGIEGADILTLQFLRAQVLEKQVQFRERVGDGRSREERRPQVAARALLYGTQREKHVERPLRPLGISEARHPVMPGRESQVLEFVALVHVEVVDTHEAEVHGVVLACFQRVRHLLQLGFQVGLAFLTPFHHGAGNVPALCFEHFEVLLHTVQLGLQYLLLYLRRLGYHAELFVREDHGVPVVVAYLPEDALTLPGREILLARVEDFGHRVSGAERPGYFMDVGFQPDNHGFIGQPEAFLLVGSAAHDKGLSAAHLVVDYPSAEQFVDSQPLEVEVGEFLVRPVVLRAHVTVESTVIEVCQAVFEVGRLLAQPFGESTPDLVYLAVGELYGLPVTHFDLPPFAVHPFEDGLGDVGRSVLQGVFQKVQAVVLTGLRADGILLRDLHVRRFRLHAVLVQVGGEGDLHLRIEERGGETLVNTFWNPPFAQVEVQVVESDGFGRRLAQSLQRFPGRGVVGILPQERLDPFGFPDDIAGDELVGNLVAVRFRVVIDTSFQFPEYSLHGSSRERGHVVRFHPAVLVQAGHKGLRSVVGVRDLIGIEGHGTLEDVGFACLAVDVTLQR